MPIDYIRYDLLVQDALRSVVRKVMTEAARSGLPGEHHFNIAFKTQAPGVVIPPAMRQRYPDEMAIILQHEFWDLAVTADAFEVSLNFSRKPERLTVPFDAITGFSDPSVPFGFKLEPRIAAEPAPAKATSVVGEPGTKSEGQPAAGAASPPRASQSASAAKSSESPAKKAEKRNDGEAAKVVSIDAFRKK
ncbi:MAG: SspB family protein [Roseiarcus sp.]